MTADRPLKTSPPARNRSVLIDDDGTGPPRAEGGPHGAAARQRGWSGGEAGRVGRALAHASAVQMSDACRPSVGPRMPSRLGPEISGRPSVLDDRHVPGDSLKASKPSPKEEITVVR